MSDIIEERDRKVHLMTELGKNDLEIKRLSERQAAIRRELENLDKAASPTPRVEPDKPKPRDRRRK